VATAVPWVNHLNLGDSLKVFQNYGDLTLVVDVPKLLAAPSGETISGIRQRFGRARMVLTSMLSMVLVGLRAPPFFDVTFLNGRVCANDLNSQAFECGNAFHIKN